MGIVVASPVQTALFFYDTLLTLPFEVKHIWQKKIKLGTVLYLLTRYPLVFNLLGLIISIPAVEVRNESQEMDKAHIQAVRLSCGFIRSLMSNRACNDFAHFSASMGVLALIGIQGDNISLNSSIIN